MHPWYNVITDLQRDNLVAGEASMAAGCTVAIVDLSQGLTAQHRLLLLTGCSRACRLLLRCAALAAEGSDRGTTSAAASPSELICHCITPDGAFWHTGRNRLLVGREKLALQGVFPNSEFTTSFSSSFEGELAGNAFNSVDFVVAFLALMSVLAESSQFGELVGPFAPTDDDLQPTPRWIANLLESSQPQHQAAPSRWSTV